MRRALFLDRDGTVIVDTGFVSAVEDVQLLPGAADGMRAASALGMALVIVSNQSGVGRGMFGLETVWQVDAEMRRQLAAEGIALAGSYYCPHHPDDRCECRKPQPALLLEAARDLDIDLAASWMVGDRIGDLAAGVAAGCRVAAIGFSPEGCAAPVLASLADLPEVLGAR